MKWNIAYFLCVLCTVSSFVQIFLKFRERVSTRQNPVNLAFASMKYEQQGSQRQVEDRRIKWKKRERNRGVLPVTYSAEYISTYNEIWLVFLCRNYGLSNTSIEHFGCQANIYVTATGLPLLSPLSLTEPYQRKLYMCLSFPWVIWTRIL
jgi:hypothetical protein